MSGRYSENANIDIYLKAHAADYVSVDRMKKESVVLHNPTMTMGLFVQPSVIQDIPYNFQNRGLTQRFLYSLPKSIVGYRSREPQEMAVEVEARFIRNIRKLLEMKPSDGLIQQDQLESKSIELTFDDKAYQLMLQLEDEREVMLRNPDIPDNLLGWLGKLTGQVIRIAALFYIADNVSSNKNDVPLTISRETLARANKLRDYFISHSEAAHGAMGANKNDKDAKYVIKRINEADKLKNRESIDYQELWQVVKRRFKRSENLRETLRYLEELNYVKNALDGQKNIVLINPSLLECEPENNSLGKLVQVSNMEGTCEESHEVEVSNRLGTLGTHSEPKPNKPEKIDEDGSGLI